MSSPESTNLVIRLELHVPVAAAGLAPAIKSQLESHNHQPVVLMTTLTEPPPRSVRPTNVRVSGSATTGSICARGQSIKGGVVAKQVWAKVFSGDLTSIPPLDTSDPGTRQVNTAGGGNWQFVGANEVPGAPCGPYTAPAPATLVVWADYNDGAAPEATSQPFGGVCNVTSDCGGMFGPSVAQGVTAAGAGAVGNGVMGASGPAMWRLTGSGFRQGPARVFNASWLLDAQEPSGERLRWSNGGDGDHAPLVELSRDLNSDGGWRLELRYKGAGVRYTRAAGQWHNVGANTLTRAADAGDNFPETLTVVPL
jgi:hypothetical protein